MNTALLLFGNGGTASDFCGGVALEIEEFDFDTYVERSMVHRTLAACGEQFWHILNPRNESVPVDPSRSDWLTGFLVCLLSHANSKEQRNLRENFKRCVLDKGLISKYSISNRSVFSFLIGLVQKHPEKDALQPLLRVLAGRISPALVVCISQLLGYFLYLSVWPKVRATGEHYLIMSKHMPANGVPFMTVGEPNLAQRVEGDHCNSSWELRDVRVQWLDKDCVSRVTPYRLVFLRLTESLVAGNKLLHTTTVSEFSMSTAILDADLDKPFDYNTGGATAGMDFSATESDASAIASAGSGDREVVPGKHAREGGRLMTEPLTPPPGKKVKAGVQSSFVESSLAEEVFDRTITQLKSEGLKFISILRSKYFTGTTSAKQRSEYAAAVREHQGTHVDINSPGWDAHVARGAFLYTTLHELGANEDMYNEYQKCDKQLHELELLVQYLDMTRR